MICKLLGALGASLVLCLAPAAAQPGPADAAGAAQAPGGPSFDVDIRAPEPVRLLLERHLALLRYREVSDLDDAELARLIAMAERDVRELVATLGFFNPSVMIAREPGTGGRPGIVVAVDPGQAALVGDVAIEFEGDIAHTAELDAVGQRDRKSTRLNSSHRRLSRMPSSA